MPLIIVTSNVLFILLKDNNFLCYNLLDSLTVNLWFILCFLYASSSTDILFVSKDRNLSSLTGLVNPWIFLFPLLTYLHLK